MVLHLWAKPEEKFNRAHTHILYFTKDKERFVFNDKNIRIPSAKQLVYKDKRANPIGKIPDDVWQFSRVYGTFKKRIENIHVRCQKIY